MTRSKPIQIDQPEGPAVITPLDRQDRILSPVVGAPKGFRRLSPFMSTYEKGLLAGGSSRHHESDRYTAGRNYGQIFLLAQSAGRDSTLALSVSRSTAGTGLGQAQSDAIRVLVAVECEMSANDRRIVRMVCGQGYWPSEAVRDVCADYKDAVTARFREALDALVEAFDAVRRGKSAVILEKVSRETER